MSEKMRVFKEFERFMSELSPVITKIEDQYSKQAIAVEKNCLNKAAGREGEFVECMLKKQDAYSAAFKQLELHLTFWKNSTFECFENSPKDLARCKS